MVSAAREWIERGCVCSAARNRTDEDIEAIREAVEAMEASGIGMDAMLALDIDFHVAVSRTAHNAILELAMNVIHLVRPYNQHDARPAVEHPRRYEFRGIDFDAAIDGLRALSREPRERRLRRARADAGLVLVVDRTSPV